MTCGAGAVIRKLNKQFEWPLADQADKGFLYNVD
jgi:hypothetical protein